MNNDNYVNLLIKDRKYKFCSEAKIDKNYSFDKGVEFEVIKLDVIGPTRPK